MSDENTVELYKNCPDCGKVIMTWWSEQNDDPQENVPEDKCWFYTDNVSLPYASTDIDGNVIIIDHDGPAL